MKLWIKILIALVLGVIAGFFLGPKAEYLKPIGTLFLSLINMIIVLLVLSSMTVGITNIHDPQKLGRVGLKTLFLYLMTTIVAISIGLLFAKVVQPGKGLELHSTSTISLAAAPTIGDIILSIVPKNPIASLVEGNILQIIVFSLFLGISINFAGEKGKPLLELLESLADVMYRLTSIVMEFSPIGVYAIMASVAGTFGVGGLWPLLKFLIAYYLAGTIHALIVFCGMLRFVKLSPWPFFRGMRDAIIVAFST